MRDKIKLLVLNTGENIIAVVDDNGHEYVADKPVVLVPNPQNQDELVFFPYLQFSEEDVAAFKQADVRHILTPKHNLLDNYYTNVQSGIDLSAVKTL